MIQLVIFDCDGVLVDSERLAIKVDSAVLTRLGWQLTEAEIIERFVGVSDEHFRREIESHIGYRLPEDWEAEVEPLYRRAFTAELRAVEGIVDALDRISLATCVASSGTHEKMRFTLGLTGLYDRFRGRIFSATEVARGKPAPDLFLYAAERMGVAPRACAVVEDSAIGVAAARAAGMRVLAYAGGVTPAAKLAGPCTAIFEHMRELPTLLERDSMGMHVRRARAEDREQLLDVWERSVRATHHFLADGDVVALRPLVAAELAGDAADWWALTSADGLVIGFLGFASGKIEGLFIDPDHRRRGGGRLLVAHAQSLARGGLAVDVNEQNEAALQFYEALGFSVVGRSPTDAGGRSFPILHMKRAAPSASRPHDAALRLADEA